MALTDNARPDPDLYAYRRMVIDEFYSGEIAAAEMRILCDGDPELDLMFKEEIMFLEAREDRSRLCIIAYGMGAAILCLIAAVIIAVYWQ